MQPTYTADQVQEIVFTLDLKGIATLSSVIQTEKTFYSTSDLNMIYQTLADRISELKRKNKMLQQVVKD